MPRKQNPETPEEQGQRFAREAQKLIDAGELDPTEADKVLHALVRKRVRPPATRR